MIEFFTKLFDTSDFPARWRCGTWTAGEGWLHVVSDVAIWSAYFAIPLILIYFARKRKDFPFTRVFWLFAAFILACGTTHLIDAIIFWYPIYRVSGLMKLITAVVSWATVIAIIKILPKAMHLPSLAATNKRLQEEIRQRRDVEADLRRATARHEALLGGTRSIVWTTDAQGKIVEPQVSWERYTGHGWDQHQGEGWANSLHEDDRQRVKEIWQNALQTGGAYLSQGRIWHAASGTYREFIAEGVPVKDAEGNILEWVGTTDDIHDLRRAETELDHAKADLVRQKSELELIYNSAPLGMSLVDQDLKFVRINHHLASINGMPADQHFGRRVDEVVPNLSEQIIPLYEELFRTGEPILNLEITGETPASAEERTWLVSFYPLTSEDGQIVAANSVVQDITERKILEDALRASEHQALQANVAKSEFLANMSHEIRTPMTAILGYADVMLGHLKDPDNRNWVLIIKRNGEHLLSLINDILDLSRIEAGKMDIEFEEFSLPQLVGDHVAALGCVVRVAGAFATNTDRSEVDRFVSAGAFLGSHTGRDPVTRSNCC
jgi:PAS domain S-box-containing protein